MIKLQRIMPYADPNWSPDDFPTAGFLVTAIDGPPGVGQILGIKRWRGMLFACRSNGEYPVIWKLQDGQWDEVKP